MVQPSARSSSRYRRRILALGAVATGALYVIGAPIFAGRIEADLEERVPAELAAAGFTGVTASFSGQDGTLTCERPLDDPEAARAIAYDVNGVRVIELDRSCRVNTSGSTSAEETAEATGDDPGDASESERNDEATDATPTTTSTTAPEVSNPPDDLASIQDVIAANPDLAFLSVLIADTDIGRTDGPTTLFAPDNAAFDAVPADVLSRLQSEPEVLADVLAHHVVDGMHTTSDLVDGELVATDGAMLEVSVGDEITVGGARLLESDIIASNGVVHVVDTVLIPDDVLQAAVAAATAVLYDGTEIRLSGVVASEVERRVLLDAAGAAVDAAAVVDELVVDPDIGLPGATAARLAELVRAVPNLAEGELGFDGSELYVDGTLRDEAAGEVLAELLESFDVRATLADPPPGQDATEDEAAALEAELNAFVTANPIRFEAGSDVLAASATEVLDRVAADALELTGVSITVEGHTDSDGVPAENQQLSVARAEAVAAELVARGVPAERIVAVGFGSERPVLADGVEDKAASRRVEFRVTASA